MASNKVIVFGPTGNVASIAAMTAQEQGAQVVLAMRDPKKSIPGLSSEQEKAGGYERVQADLTKPDTVAEAVTKTGAKTAFIYLAHGSPDHMKATIQALKDSGVEFVVFLSSFTITGPLAEVPPYEIIAFIHAQVEINLEEIYGSKAYVALRPGGFATNVMFWSKGIADGEVKLYCPEAKFDYITPVDMGRVGGSILAKGGQQNGEKIVYLYGPRLTSQEVAVTSIGNVAGRDIKMTPIGAEEAVEEYKAAYVPEPIAKYLVKKLGESSEAKDPKARLASYDDGVANIEKYGGKSPTTFDQWAESNKHLFGA